jgi:hypothetical protein
MNLRVRSAASRHPKAVLRIELIYKQIGMMLDISFRLRNCSVKRNLLAV